MKRITYTAAGPAPRTRAAPRQHCLGAHTPMRRASTSSVVWDTVGALGVSAHWIALGRFAQSPMAISRHEPEYDRRRSLPSTGNRLKSGARSGPHCGHNNQMRRQSSSWSRSGLLESTATLAGVPRTSAERHRTALDGWSGPKKLRAVLRFRRVTRMPGEQSEDDGSVLSRTGVNPNPYLEPQ